MKFLGDENVERRLLSSLKQSGYDVTAIGNEYPHGLSDQEVLTIAKREDRVLLTNDRSDFGELIFRYHQPHCGVILFRIRSGEIALKKAKVEHVLTEYPHQLTTSFFVITPTRIRVRRSPEVEHRKAA